jgi:glycosyltransferase involved in cell wall biosynthesis
MMARASAACDTPSAENPQLSLVIVTHDMRREILRTIRSLSPGMQRDIQADDYEIIVVDNGSQDPVDLEACARFGAHLRWLSFEQPSPSPVSAINWGLSQAGAPLVGAMIDGARLASPGLLRHALIGARLHPRPVIATVGFHIGPDLQQRCSTALHAEDALLESVDWTSDGYRLFDISVFAGSSQGGWFRIPAESNALFLPKALWEQLGDYDERFQSTGGGLANLDAFARACSLPDIRLIVLLGEATFHQMKTDSRS